MTAAWQPGQAPGGDAGIQQWFKALPCEHSVFLNCWACSVKSRKQKQRPKSPVDPTLCFIMCMCSNVIQQTSGLVLCLQAAV